MSKEQDINDIVNQIKLILQQDLRVSKELIERTGDEETLFGKGLGLDSIEAMTLATKLELFYAIEFADEVLTEETFSSIRKLAETVITERGAG